MKTTARFLIVGLLVAGCGGGGGGSSPPPGPVTSTLSFPVRSGLNALTANGYSSALTANGTPATEATNGLCSGTLNQTTGPANAATTFEGVPALAAVRVLTIAFSNCTPVSSTTTSTTYYDSNYLPLGFNQPGVEYGVFLAPPVIPNSAMVGNVGTVGTITLYTDSTKAVGSGHRIISFIVEPDTASTAIINVIEQDFDALSQLLFTEQDRYRITSTGALTLVSVDVQYNSSPRLVFRL